MAKPRSKNDQYGGSPKTVDRQMIIPVDQDKAFFPVVGAGPKRGELNDNERKSTPNTFADAPKIVFGKSTQSRY